MSDSSDQYTHRKEHGVTHFHDIVYGGNCKPVAITITEPNKMELNFLVKTNRPKVTIINNLDYPFL